MTLKQFILALLYSTLGVIIGNIFVFFIEKAYEKAYENKEIPIKIKPSFTLNCKKREVFISNEFLKNVVYTDKVEKLTKAIHSNCLKNNKGLFTLKTEKLGKYAAVIYVREK